MRMTVQCNIGVFVCGISGKCFDTAADTEAVSMAEIQRISAECDAFVIGDAEIGVCVAVAVACYCMKGDRRKAGTQRQNFGGTVTEMQDGIDSIGVCADDGLQGFDSSVRIGENKKLHIDNIPFYVKRQPKIGTLGGGLAYNGHERECLTMKQQRGLFEDASSANEKLSQVMRLNDAQLQAALRAVAEASGLGARRTDALTRDPDAIRRKLSSIRAEDLEKMLAQISPEQMAVLTEQIQRLQKKEP